MTAPTASAPIRRTTTGSGVNFLRVLKSEWIKVTTIPSTVILLAVTFVVMVGLAALFAWSLVIGEQSPDSEGPGGRGFGGSPFAELAYGAPSGGIIFGQLLIASLAVVLIASEWGTGMIRSTMVAVPKRTPALLAKNLVIAGIAFILGASSALMSYFVVQPILAAENLDFAVSTEGVLPSVINTGTYLALIAVISLAIGTLLRNTAGGVVTAVGLFFVLPVIVVNLIAGLADWIPDAARFLPTNAGEQLVAVVIGDGELTQWEGGGVMTAWAIVLLLLALIVTKKRDV